MPQSIISQFEREYNAPIETNRQVSNITIRDAIDGAIRWEGMIVYVISEGKSYELRGGTDNTFWQDFQGIDDAPADGNYYSRKDNTWQLNPNENRELYRVISKPVTSGTGLNTVVNFNMPANTLSAWGDAFEFNFLFQADGILNLNQVTISVGMGGSARTITSFPSIGGSWVLRISGTVQRTTNANNQNLNIVSSYANGIATSGWQETLGGSGWGAAVGIIVQMQDASGSNVLQLIGGYIRKIIP